MSNIHVFFDLETGGLEPFHPVMQIAAVAMKHGEQLSCFEIKIDCNLAECDPEALRINGYTQQRWRNAVSPREAAQKFAKWLEPFKSIEKISKAGKKYKVAQLAGYNSSTFDAPRLQSFFENHEVFLPADRRVLDVMQLVMWYFEINPEGRPDNIKLSSVCEFFGIPLTNAHDALADTVATAQLAQKVGECLVESILNKYAVNDAAAQAAQLVELERWK